MVVGKLWQLAICTPLASRVIVGKLYTVGKLRDGWHAVAVGDLVSCVTVSKLCIVAKLCGGQ